MGLSYRPMRVADVRACVALMAAHPVLRPRYGQAIKHMPAIWSRLLGQESLRAIVFEMSDSGQSRIVAMGVSAFVTEDFLRKIKTPPFVWIGPELVGRILKGRSPLLSDREVAEANSTTGLNCVVWTGCIDRGFMGDREVNGAVPQAFPEQHSGFYLKELVGQPESQIVVEVMLNSGGFYLCGTDGKYVRPARRDIQDLIHKPHIIGVTRDLAVRQLGTLIYLIFTYNKPRLYLNRSQQRLLTAALNGGTDDELAKELAVSLSTVKKTWRTIYDRICERAPELFPAAPAQEELRTERGKAKKHRLLGYLRNHPEELRPITRKAQLPVSVPI